MKFVIKGSVEFAQYARNNGYDTTTLAGNCTLYYYLVENKKIIDYGAKNKWDFLLLTLEDLNMKYTIEQLKTGNYIFLLNEGQYTHLKNLGINLCGFYGEKYYATTGTHGKLHDYLDGEIVVNFADIDFETKEIIGYLTPMDLFGGKVKKGDIFKISNISCDKIAYGFNTNPVWNMPKEIVESWEPVYKEVIKSKVIELGNPLRTFTIWKDKIEMVTGNNEIEVFNNSHLDHVKACFKRLMELKSFNIDVKTIQIGCKYGVELIKKDLENIQSIQSEL